MDPVLFTIVIFLVLLISTGIFHFTLRRERKRENEIKKELNRALSRAENYRNAVINSSEVVFEVNLTKNVIVEGNWDNRNNRAIMDKDIVDLKPPIDYDKYIERWKAKYIHPDYREIFGINSNRLYLIGAFKEGRREITFEYQGLALDEQPLYARRTIFMAEDFSTGDIIAYCSMKDITDQMEDKLQIRDYEQLLILTAAENFKGIRRVDIASGLGKYIFFEDGQVRQQDFGFWKDSAEHQLSFTHPDDVEKVRRVISMESISNMDENETKRVDYRGKSVNSKGHNNIYTTRVSVKTINGRKIAIFTTIDNTLTVEKELRQKGILKEALEKAESANNAKTSFLFSMSHDIRTPMNAILGYAELLKKHLDDTDVRERYLRNINTSGQYLLSLINNVLETARIESGKVEVIENPGYCSSHAEEIVSVFIPEATKKNISLELKVDVDTDYIYYDKTKVEQIMVNIISNAIKYTESGGRVDVSVTEIPGGAEGYVLQKTVVKDNGIGISEEFLPHIFESFTREKAVTQNKIVGTGLGLGIVKKLVEMLKGTIEVKSTLGQGTEVAIVLPFRVAQKEEKDNSENQQHDAEIFNGKRILLAEDNELNMEIVVELLSEVGLIVECAENGIICVDMLNDKPAGYYDLILMDMQMPEMDGLQATEEIRRLWDKKKSCIPIVAMTANAFDEDKKRAFDAGMDDFVTKPIEIDKLLNKIAEIICE